MKNFFFANSKAHLNKIKYKIGLKSIKFGGRESIYVNCFHNIRKILYFINT